MPRTAPPPSLAPPDAGFRVQGAGCRVQGSGFKVQGAGFRAQGSGFRVKGLKFGVLDLGLRVQGLGQDAWLQGAPGSCPAVSVLREAWIAAAEQWGD